MIVVRVEMEEVILALQDLEIVLGPQEENKITQ